jgi:hypothetical protein
MLSERERRALEEIERAFRAEVREPVRTPPGPVPRSRTAGEHPVTRALTCVAGGISVLLLVVGVPSAAVAVAAASALLWLLWRYREALSDRVDAPSPVPDADQRARRQRRRQRSRQRRRDVAEYLRRMAENR